MTPPANAEPLWLVVRALVSRSEPADECSNGIAGRESEHGEACCPIECGETCGGAGCKGFGGGESAGLGSSSCCVGTILEEGSLCSDTESAPCIIGELFR